jgi:hypothetical protein
MMARGLLTSGTVLLGTTLLIALALKGYAAVGPVFLLQGLSFCG